MHWTKQAVAIWSNACTLHAATVRIQPLSWILLPLSLLTDSPSLTPTSSTASGLVCVLRASVKDHIWIQRRHQGAKPLVCHRTN